jgi:FKBP-type peptidyl-prolyl cis-trans isomerase SlyD
MTENILSAVQDDTVVQLAYNLVVDGEEIESEVLEYLHGHQNIIPGLENALTGLEVGDSKEVLVLAEEAYGDSTPTLLCWFPATLPSGF